MFLAYIFIATFCPRSATTYISFKQYINLYITYHCRESLGSLIINILSLIVPFRRANYKLEYGTKRECR